MLLISSLQSKHSQLSVVVTGIILHLFNYMCQPVSTQYTFIFFSQITLQLITNWFEQPMMSILFVPQKRNRKVFQKLFSNS